MNNNKKFFDVIADRRSIRAYKDEPVPREALEQILLSATQAPSGTNSQPWHFMVIEDRQIRHQMASAVHKKMDEILSWQEAVGKERRINGYRRYFTFFEFAPVVIAALGTNHREIVRRVIEAHGMNQSRNRPSSAHLSLAAAVQNLVLTATALGYGSCWMTGPLIAADEIEAILNIEEPWYLSAVIPLGKPAEYPPPRPRKGLNKVVTWISAKEQMKIKEVVRAE